MLCESINSWDKHELSSARILLHKANTQKQWNKMATNILMFWNFSITLRTWKDCFSCKCISMASNCRRRIHYQSYCNTLYLHFCCYIKVWNSQLIGLHHVWCIPTGWQLEDQAEKADSHIHIAKKSTSSQKKKLRTSETIFYYTGDCSRSEFCKMF